MEGPLKAQAKSRGGVLFQKLRVQRRISKGDQETRGAARGAGKQAPERKSEEASAGIRTELVG